MDQTVKKAVLYCRVSDKKQRNEGHGLDSQEHRCREYAASRGYEVDAVFTDIKTAGGDFMGRPGMVALIQFLRASAHKGYVVIFDDLKRFARDTEFHIRLRTKLAACRALPECLNFKFEDTPEGEFIETIIAAQGQLERKQNARQVLQKMKARLERGYYVFSQPVGYRYQKNAVEGQVLVRDEPLASILQEALEGYASGRFQIQAEVMRFLLTHPEFANRKSSARRQFVKEVLTRPVYAGYVESERWGVSLRQGRHDPLISYETYLKIQDRLKGGSNAPQRKDISADFPLRGAVVCGECNGPLTSCWSKGRNGHYPYYLCIQRGCTSYGKSIRRDVIEGQFADMLQDMVPSANLFRAASAMFKNLWNHKLISGQSRARTMQTELVKVEKQVEQFLDRLVDADSPSVIAAYETRIKRLENQKLLLKEKIASGGRPMKSFEESLRTALEFLGNPWKLWDSGDFEHRRMVLKLTFAQPLAYVRNEGFRTANLSWPFKALSHFGVGENSMVGPLGLEPRTKGFTRPRRFRREWTISSPPGLEKLRGAGRSSLLSSALERSGSLCTFRRCTAGLAQGCHRPRR